MKVLILLSLLLVNIACASSPKLANPLVLIHGANFNSSSYNQLKLHLEHRNVFSIDLPGRNDEYDPKNVTLELSARELCTKLVSLGSKSDLVVHSQGGAIVNQALRYCPENMNKIIYISAVIPLKGEKAFDLLSKDDEKFYFEGIEYIKKSGELVIIDEQKFLESFAGDAKVEERESILKSSVTEPSKIADGVLDFDNTDFKRLKKYYVFTLRDKIISFKSQKKITERVKFERTYVLDSEHLPMVTKTKELAAIINKILSE